MSNKCYLPVENPLSFLNVLLVKIQRHPDLWKFIKGMTFRGSHGSLQVVTRTKHGKKGLKTFF